MTLAELEEGDRATVTAVRCQKDLRLRLQSLGIYGGASVKVVGRNFGISIVKVFNMRLALADEALAGVEVEKK